MNEIDIVRDVSQRFEQGSIPYMLTGSMAMNYYAQPRMTRDIDVVIAIAPRMFTVWLICFVRIIM